jgi:hypothetical protein
MTAQNLLKMLEPVLRAAKDHELDASLQAHLNASYPHGQSVFSEIENMCHQGVREGWACDREAGGIRYGRLIKPGPASAGFSIDLVLMRRIVGPHHRHPRGEIDMIMPIDSQARFDGHGAGWLVYGPETDHSPTVTDGAALILYALPGGEIAFG